MIGFSCAAAAAAGMSRQSRAAARIVWALRRDTRSMFSRISAPLDRDGSSPMDALMGITGESDRFALVAYSDRGGEAQRREEQAGPEPGIAQEPLRRELRETIDHPRVA